MLMVSPDDEDELSVDAVESLLLSVDEDEPPQPTSVPHNIAPVNKPANSLLVFIIVSPISSLFFGRFSAALVGWCSGALSPFS
jgi:hypothetical protein